ncbi:hypothetical protein [Streptomyces mirabilis]|uniref:hypothetical protein n=1 Tax=Streptomyces mirabilis TaxID=68239 RepID=UPI00101B53AA|nr:hypothetical protein [Streptomyces mirabilis]
MQQLRRLRQQAGVAARLHRRLHRPRLPRDRLLEQATPACGPEGRPTRATWPSAGGPVSVQATGGTLREDLHRITVQALGGGRAGRLLGQEGQ